MSNPVSGASSVRPITLPSGRSGAALVVGPSSWLEPLRHLLATPALADDATRFGFAPTPDGGLQLPAPTLFASETAGEPRGFEVVASSGERPFLTIDAWLESMVAGRLPLHASTDTTQAARSLRELVEDTVLLGLLPRVLDRAVLQGIGARFGPPLAQATGPVELAKASAVAFFRADLVEWCAALRHDDDSGKAIAFHRPELEFRLNRRLAAIVDPKSGPPLKPFVGWALRRRGDETPPPDLAEGTALDTLLAQGRIPPDPAELWQRLPDASRLSPGLSKLMLGASLGRIRLGQRPHAVLQVPPEIPLDSLRGEFARVVPLADVGGRSVDDSTFLPAPSQGPAHRVVFVSRESGGPTDRELVDCWTKGPAPAGFQGQNTYQVFGTLLGYPACCVKRFNELFVVEDRRFNLDIFLATRGDRVGPWPATLNHFLHDWLVPFPHYPCRYDCEASREQSRAYFAEIAALHPRLAARVRQLLPGLVVVFENDDYVHLDVTPAAATGVYDVHGVKRALLRVNGRRERFAPLLQGPTTLRIEADGTLVVGEKHRPERGAPQFERTLALWFTPDDAT